MIKVLGLSLYGPLAASNRYRLGQYVIGLRSFGIELEVQHLLGDDYLRARFSGGALPMVYMLKAGFKRFADLCSQSGTDLIMLQGELLPLIPGWIERLLIRKSYIYDFDDAFYLKYRSGKMSILKPILGRKFESVIEGAAAVTAGNHLLTDYASSHNTRTHYLPTVVDIERYQASFANRGSEVFTVGWIGSPSTSVYLNELIEPLSILGKESSVRFIVIGCKAPKIPNVEVVEIEWQENSEVDLINSFDVGVMPLSNDEWARGKCAFKLIQYMACAVPVIASPVGANVDVVNIECGLLASTHQDWLESLRLLRDSPATRIEMGFAARARVSQHYSLQINLPVLASVIHEIMCR